MKERTSLISLLIIIALTASAQVPQKFNYQAVVRDVQNGLITGQDVGFKLSILEGTANGLPVYVETHNATTNDYGIANLFIGDGSVISGVFSDIPWGEESWFLKVEVDPSGGSAYEHVGTSQLISVPYSLYSANLSSPTKKFTIQEEEGHPVDSALFEVRNAEGQTVFAVYPEGTRVYILDEEAKGRKGGFAVGGYSRTTKGITQEYMRVTPDSIRMYFDEASTKGRKGGFAVGGYSRTTKAPIDNYFELTPDSARFILVAPTGAMGANALSVVTKTRNGEPEGTNGTNLFNLTRENYAIGHRAGESLTNGMGNVFLGYESGLNTTEGSYNSYIGYRAGLKNMEGYNNVAIGFSAGESHMAGDNNVFIGWNAGQNTEGHRNVYIGSEVGRNNLYGGNNVMIGVGVGVDADTSYANVFIGADCGVKNSGGIANVFIGQNAGFENTSGNHNTFIGHGSGGSNVNDMCNTFIGAFAGTFNSEGENNTFMGTEAGTNHQQGSNNLFLGAQAGIKHVTGEHNVFIGQGTGWNNTDGSDNIFIGMHAGVSELGSGKLYIDHGGSDMEQALIYGEFYNHKVRINSQLGIGRTPDTYALEVNGEVSKSTAGEWLVNSDARIKKDISEIDNALGLISRLRPVTFRYTDDWMQKNPSVRDRVYYNFIAQEYREVFPESVRPGGGSLEGDEDPLLQLDSHPAGIVAIKAIQELAQQNREQQALIEELMQKVSVLESGSNSQLK